MRRLFAAAALAGLAAVAGPLLAQTPSSQPPRAVRRDVPLTNTIRRALTAGTRTMTGTPGPNYWQLQVDYTINARVDTTTDEIYGTETVLLHNNSPDNLGLIVLRLDHNMFRAGVQKVSIPAETTDGMVVTKITVNGETVNLTGGVNRVAGAIPLSATGLDQTLARISLPAPIATKATATLQIDWHTKLPGGNAGRGHRMTQRFGHDLYQPAQWYPRVAVYDDLRGWETNVYLGPSEFYNNFGKFDVTYDVPGGWIVSSTGVLQNPEAVLTATARERLSHVLESDNVITIVSAEENGPGKSTAPGDRLKWHFVADMVNDVAWATAKNYVWQATRATIPAKGPIPVSAFFQPEHRSNFNAALPIARHALEFYSKLWTPYPFPKFALQDGPNNGMEYPMVINSDAGPADHETGHQWWPMVVSNNETVYGWMDEGFNQYMNILSDADAAGHPANLNRHGQTYGSVSGNEAEPPMMWNANYGGPQYGFQTYQKTPLMLSALGGIVGDEAVQKAMSEYAKAWSFKHPSPWDYVFFMNAQLKQDLSWFWYSWLWTTDSVDASIANVATAGGKTTVTVRQDGQMMSPVILKVEFAATGDAIKPMANARMVNATTAIVTFPVDVWFDGRRTYDAALDFGTRPITTITLDPGCRFPDKAPADNVWPKTAPGPSCQG